MDLFGSSYYKHLRSAFSLAGLWPYEETTYSQLRRICFITGLLYYLLMAVLRLIMTKADLESIAQIIPIASALMISITRYGTTIVKIRAIRNLLDWMKNDWETVTSTDELWILRNYAEHARLCAKIYSIFSYLIVLSMVLQQFWSNILDIVVPLNESRPRSFTIEVAHLIDPDKYYYVIALDAVGATSIHFFCTGVSDLFLIIMVVHACGICQVLGYRFDRLYRNLRPHECNNKTKCIFRKEVEQCIYKHGTLKSFVDHINQCYMASITIELVWGGTGWITILTYFFKEFMIEHFSAQVIKYTTYILGYTLSMIFYTFLMQSLCDNSRDLHNRIMIGNWNQACRPIQKLLIFLMQNSAKDLSIYFAHKIPISYETFIIVVKILGSYMMAFVSLCNK